MINKICNMMNRTLEMIFAWTWWSIGWLSFGAVCYEHYALSERHARKRIERGLPPYDDEEGQLYLEFMKDYLD